MKVSYAGIWRDAELSRELAEKLRQRGNAAVDEVLRGSERETTAEEYAPAPGSDEEAIILGVGRPSLLVQDGTFSVPESDVWKQRLATAKDALGKIIASVGRIQIGDGATAQMIGTGWLIAADVVVTNRHVAKAFSAKDADGWTFTPGGIPMLDWRREHERADTDEVALARVIHVEADGGPDVALFKLARASSSRPIRLATNLFGPEPVAIVGYPGWDGKRNPGPDMVRIFGDVFEVKRLAPGFLSRVGDRNLEHDCSTLGGNSGSVVWGLETRNAVGLHYAGKFRETNHAVPAPLVHEIAQRQRVL